MAMTITNESKARRVPNGDQRRSQDIDIDLKILNVLDYISSLLDGQWDLFQQATGYDSPAVDNALLYIEEKIEELGSLLRRK